jgi:hypothetical protein
MKRLLATLTLILCLSFPALAGHVQADGVYCDCNNPDHTMNTRSADTGIVEGKNQDSTPETELGLILMLLAAWLKVKA